MWSKHAGGFAAYVNGYLRANHTWSWVPYSDLTRLGVILASAARLALELPSHNCRPTNTSYPVFCRWYILAYGIVAYSVACVVV
jgi:hypothetical protein